MLPTTDLRAMLGREGLGAARLFIVPETGLDGLGMLPAEAVEPVGRWLRQLAADAAGRAEIARRTLMGTVRALGGRVSVVAQASREQQQAGAVLAEDARTAHQDAVARILEATRDGALLRGEVLARWQDFVGTGEFFRVLEQNIGRMRDRVGAFFRGEPAPAVKVETAIETGLQAVIMDEAAKAAEDTDQRWRSDPAGRQLLGTDDLSGTSAGFPDRVAEEIRAWQGGLMELIRTEGQGKRTQARWLSLGINGLGAALMIVVFSMTAGLSGLEVGVAGGTAVVGQRLLEAVFGEDAVRRLARTAREDLNMRCPWRAAIRSAAREGRERLPDALDQATAGTELLAGRKSWWWGLFNLVQWLALLTALGGLAWLGVPAGLGYLLLPVPEVPRVEGWPVPTLMIAGGAVLGIVLAVAGKFIAGAAAGLRAAARKKLNAAVAAVANRLVVEPVEVEVSRLKSFNAALKSAARN
jgi:hypothetical protein